MAIMFLHDSGYDRDKERFLGLHCSSLSGYSFHVIGEEKNMFPLAAPGVLDLYAGEKLFQNTTRSRV